MGTKLPSIGKRCPTLRWVVQLKSSGSGLKSIVQICKAMAGRLLAWKGTCPTGRCREWLRWIRWTWLWDTVGLSLWPLCCWFALIQCKEGRTQCTILPRLQTRHLVEDHPQRPNISLAKIDGSPIGIKISPWLSNYTTDPLWEHGCTRPLPNILALFFYFLWLFLVELWKSGLWQWITPALTPYGLFLQISGERYEGVPTVELASHTQGGFQITGCWLISRSSAKCEHSKLTLLQEFWRSDVEVFHPLTAKRAVDLLFALHLDG